MDIFKGMPARGGEKVTPRRREYHSGVSHLTRDLGLSIKKATADLARRWRTATDGRWRSGVTAIEAALVMPAFLLLSFGIIEVSLLYLAASTLEGQVGLAARQIRTGNIQNAADPIGDFEQMICGGQTFIQCSKLIIDVRNFTSFSDITYPSYFDADGEPQSNAFLPGGAGDTVLVRVAYKWSILTPFLAPYLGDGGGGTKLLHSAAVFRTEPYNGPIN